MTRFVGYADTKNAYLWRLSPVDYEVRYLDHVRQFSFSPLSEEEHTRMHENIRAWLTALKALLG